MSPAPHRAAPDAAAFRAARQAWARGQAALRAGDPDTALRWLDRACRLAPDDPLLRLARATAWLHRDPARAAAEFTALAATRDDWDSWLGLAAARWQAGARKGAIAALREALRRHPAPTETSWTGLADRIAPHGWCAVTLEGAIRHGPAGLPKPELLLDGRPLALPTLGGRNIMRHGNWLRLRHAGAEATGSPLDLDALRRACAPEEPPGTRHAAPRRPTPARKPPRAVPAPPKADVVIPVYRDAAATRACLASVLAAIPRGTRVIVVDDASPEPDLATALDRLAAAGRISLVRHARNRGFPAAANTGLRLARAAGHDALLLNADTLVARGFLPRLRAAAYAAADIGTACPLSNNATILSYPDPAGGDPMPGRRETARLAALAWRANGAEVADIPTGVGFCLYLRHDCLRATGLFDAARFGRGYGEENDFCQRAAAAGWRHVAAPGVFVAHRGEASFGAAAAGLRARHAPVLAGLHPGYAARVAAHLRADPLFAARRRLDAARWHAARPPGAEAVVLLTHALGGGVARSVAARAATLRAAGAWPVLLAPADAAQQAAVGIAGYPNLRFTLPGDMDALLRLLRGARPRRVEFHHTLGLPPAILGLADALGVPHDVHVHDYHWICPRLVLSGAHGRYCGEPDLAGCRACVRARGSRLNTPLGVAELRARSAALLEAADAVTAPSADTAQRLHRYFPGLRPRVAPPDDPAPAAPFAAPPSAPPPMPRAPGRRVAVIGAIGAEKGIDVLLAIAREAATAGRNLEFVVVGHTTRDAALLATGRVFITGPYQPGEAVALARAQQADLALLPSVVPETWCHALTEAWAAGLPVLAFDLGAPAERIRAGGRGWLLPPGAPPATINRALLAARW